MRRRGTTEEMPGIVLLVPDPGFDSDGEPDETTAVGVQVVERPLTQPVEVAEHVHRVVERLVTGVAKARSFKAPAGPRPGVMAQERRRGDSVEIVQTCHVRPAATESLVDAGGLDALRLSRLRLGADHERRGRADYVWRARLRTGVVGGRLAVLHIRSTPSANLTVLELIPERPRWFGTRRFVTSGVRCIDELAKRIELLTISE